MVLPVAPLTERLIQASTGGCSCLTKSTEWRWHDPLCHFRLFSECLKIIGEMPQPTRRIPSQTGNTDRVYFAAQEAFRAWCHDHEVRFPGTTNDVANYLQTCITQRGATTVSVHLSAIARLYRERGRQLDVKTPAIQAIVTKAKTLRRK